jgi:hypothetical protein
VPQLPDGFVALTDADDSWLVSTSATGGTTATTDDGSRITWDRPATIGANEDLTLRFRVVDAHGAPAALEPYMGMAAHAVIVARDQSVFVHVHPMGTVTMAAQQAFALRDAGDTTANGRLNLSAPGMPPMALMPAVGGSAGEVSIPYAFPKLGDYRIYIQVKHAGRILTAAFDVRVAGSR